MLAELGPGSSLLLRLLDQVSVVDAAGRAAVGVGWSRSMTLVLEELGRRCHMLCEAAKTSSETLREKAA